MSATSGGDADTLPFRSKFLAALPSDEAARVIRLAEDVASEAESWALRYPVVRRIRIWPIVLSVVAASRCAPFASLVIASKVGLWAAALDDYADEVPVDDRAVIAELRVMQQALMVPPAVPSAHALAEMLREIDAELRHYPLRGALAELWERACAQTVGAMLREAIWRQALHQGDWAALPGYATYLRNGRFSIGSPQYVWAALITQGDEVVIDHQRQLLRLEYHTSVAIRLANDLRTSRREAEEGTINALVLLERQARQGGLRPRDAYAAAESQVRADQAERLAQIDRLQRAVPRRLALAAASIADLARFACDYYSRQDYRPG